MPRRSTARRPRWRGRRRTRPRPRTPDKPRFVAGSLGPDDQDRVASRRTSTTRAPATSPGTSSREPTRRPRAASSRAARTSCSSRRSSTRSTRKAAIFAVERALRRAGLAPAGDRQRHDHRPVGPQRCRGQTVGAFWNSMRHARPLAFGLNCALGAEMLRPVRRRSCRASPTFPCVTYPERRPAQRLRRLRRDSRPRRRRMLGRARARGRAQHRRLAAAARRPTTSRAIAAAVAGLPPRAIPTVEPAHAPRRAWSRSTSAPTRSSSTSASAPT